MKRLILLFTLFLAPPLPLGAEPFDPPALYLSWRTDPTTTMVIRWHSLIEQNRSAVVRYRREGEADWRTASGTSHPMPYSDRTVHVVELTGLAPGTVYRFRPGEDGAEFKFRTPPDRGPVRFIAGGDTYGRTKWYNRLDPRDLFGIIGDGYYDILRDVNRQAARQNPMFVVIGGDITYSDGHPDRAERWYRWLEAWKEDMVTSDGLLIPIVPVIGNHEVRKNTYKIEWYSDDPYNPAEQAPYFYSLFVTPDTTSYRVLDFGRYMSLILLDSGHTYLVDEQAGWLSAVLKDRADIPHKFAFYHVPAYPSYRSFEGRESRAIRKHWVPLFERFGLHAAFEHHDHTYKRTYPIRQNRRHADGVLYLGDGAWGRIRTPKKPADRWYLAFAAREYHFILVTLNGARRAFTAINDEGEVFDRYPAEQAIREPDR